MGVSLQQPWQVCRYSFHCTSSSPEYTYYCSKQGISTMASGQEAEVQQLLKQLRETEQRVQAERQEADNAECRIRRLDSA
jgi:hypothetical protein